MRNTTLANLADEMPLLLAARRAWALEVSRHLDMGTAPLDPDLRRIWALAQSALSLPDPYAAG